MGSPGDGYLWWPRERRLGLCSRRAVAAVHLWRRDSGDAIREERTVAGRARAYVHPRAEPCSKRKPAPVPPVGRKRPGNSGGGSFPFGRRLGGDRLRTERVVGFFDRLSRGSTWVHKGAYVVLLFFLGSVVSGGYGREGGA